MKLLRYWKIILVLVLLFVAGVVSGSVATHQVIKRGFERALNFENWKAGVMHVLQSKLKLTPEQHQKIAVFVDERGREIRAEFGKSFNEGGRILVHLQKDIDGQLTPQQRAVHNEMKRDLRVELKRKFNFELPPE